MQGPAEPEGGRSPEVSFRAQVAHSLFRLNPGGGTARLVEMAGSADPAAPIPPIPPIQERTGPLRYLYLGLGFVFVGLGTLGIILPGLPTTPFMILAAWMFSKSSARFHAWLWNHRLFGPYVREWNRHRVIPIHAKILSSSFMGLGLGGMIYRGAPWPLLAATLALCAWGTWFIYRCPSRPPGPT